MVSYILEEPKKIRAVETKIPVPTDTEVLIHVKYVGICGSDIHLFNGTYNAPHSYPLRFGHEWSGVVEAVGKNVTKVSVGDSVTGDCSQYCGVCPMCAKDKNLCAHIEKFGITVDGATSEYIIRDEKYVYKAPEGVGLSHLCLTEPVAVAAHLIEKVRKSVPEGFIDKRVLVLGGGVIGMSALMLFIHMEGCKQVELYDLSEHRTEIAKSENAVIPMAEDMDPGEGGGDYASMYATAKYDVVIETTGVPSVFANAFNLVKPGGVLGCVGMAAKAEIPQKLIVTKSLTVVGSIGGTGDFPRAMEFLQKCPHSAKKLVSHYLPIGKAEEAFLLATDTAISMKVILEV